MKRLWEWFVWRLIDKGWVELPSCDGCCYQLIAEDHHPCNKCRAMLNGLKSHYKHKPKKK